MTTKLQTALIVLAIFACGLIAGLVMGGGTTKTITATEPAQTVTVTRTVHQHTHTKLANPSIPEPSAAEQAAEESPEITEGSER